jgi:hypothetical protein
MKERPIYAEERPYFDTTVHPARSQGEIMEMLEDFGADQVLVVQGQASGRYAWMVRFQWQRHNYRFVFTPLPCREPTRERSFGGKKRKYNEQARYQMGRIAVWFVKAILTAAEAQPDALFGFLELSGAGAGSVPPTTAELDVSKLERLAPLLPDIPQKTE